MTVNEKLARAWFAATALAVFLGLVIQAFVTADATGFSVRRPDGCSTSSSTRSG